MKCRGEWSSLLTVAERVTETSAENGHGKLFINNSDRSLKLTSHFMFFFPPPALIMLLLSEQLAQVQQKDPMCKHSDTITPLFHQKLHTHVLEPNMAPLSTCHRLACTPPIQGFFSLIGCSSPQGWSCVLQQTR